MTRAHQQRSVAVVLTAALLAVLAVVGGAHATAHRQQRSSATPQHVVGAGLVGAHHVVDHDAHAAAVHLDLSTGPTDPWTPPAERDVPTAVPASQVLLLGTSTSHDSRAPPTA